MSSSKTESSTSWKQFFSTPKVGSDYFASQQNILSATPGGYFSAQGIDFNNRDNLMREWRHWMKRFRTSDIRVLQEFSKRHFGNLEVLANKAIEDRLLLTRHAELTNDTARHWSTNSRYLATRMDKFYERKLSEIKEAKLERESKVHQDVSEESVTNEDTATTNLNSQLGLKINDEATTSKECVSEPTAHGDLADEADVEIIWSRGKSSPFYHLIEYVFQKTKGKPAVLPTSIPEDLSSNHRELYKAALQELSKSGSVQFKKDVLVMLSGIINTVMPSGRSFTISKQIMTSSQLAPVLPSSTQKAVKILSKTLLGVLYPTLDKDPYADPQFVQLQKAIWRKLCQEVDQKHTESGMATYITLLIMQQIVAWVDQASFQPPTSEHVYVSAWTCILNTLFMGTKLRVVPGELVSRSSANARQVAENEFGLTTSTVSGRKVDMSLRIQVDNQWRSEIAVFEFKPSNASQRICEIQQKKSVRLNAAILLDLEARGLDLKRHHPVIAEGKGLSMDFYALKRYEDVLGAGRATVKGITLPSDTLDLKTFLKSEGILTLFVFREHLRRFAIDVTDALARSKATPFGDGEGDGVHSEDEEAPLTSITSDVCLQPSTPPLRKRSHPFVLFSPSKKDKRNQGRCRSLTEMKHVLDDEDECEDLD